MERILITAREANISVERQWMGAGESWITIDRYTTDDLAKLPKRQPKWIKQVHELLSQHCVKPAVDEPIYDEGNRINWPIDTAQEPT